MTKGAPTLKDAYKLLGLNDPVAWEAHIRGGFKVMGVQDDRRQIGTTTLLMIEACLDAWGGKKVLVVGHTVSDRDRLRQVCDDILVKLGAPRDTHKKLRFLTREGWERGTAIAGWHPDSTYQDHYQGVGEDERPLPGPYGHIRTVEQNPGNPDRWNAKDYDGDLIMVLDTPTAQALSHEHPTRIKYVPRPAVSIPVLGGGQLLNPARAVATRNVGLTNGMMKPDPDDFDGVALKPGDRVLLTGQLDPVENGIYSVTGSGSDGLCYFTPDVANHDGDRLMVTDGDVNGSTLWVCDRPMWLQVSGISTGTLGIQSSGITLQDAYNDAENTMTIEGNLQITGSLSAASGSIGLANTTTRKWVEASTGDEIRIVTLPDGAKLKYRNGLLEDVEGAIEDDTVDPDDPSPLINILADK